ncbi:Signal transduction protein containing GAF and PtsI domains [Variovorax sp. HW608]|uniref:GAF domain-containing protein n=1 Tax=Variovorax sp. HW608 TaxID=1034889 RepID=UPI00081FC94E|nr:GAF domain-containing protein [Variovorax sp. HW608]SCK57667.1 Signal transduction protein containing GAF and PtsI domains [Variovorax sp. HW608]
MSTCPPSLDDIRACFEGAIPAIMATCARDGTPNVAYISQVHYVDERHVALSYQFFNKTRANILANPRASVLLMDPVIAAFYRLRLRYLRTESGGALFERMKAQLAGIASHSGMAGVFRLLGADVYEVEAVESVEGERLAPVSPPKPGLLAGVRRAAERMAACCATDELLQTVLAALNDHLGVRHAMVLMLDAATQRLYTVASCGYAISGIGSEIEMGHGVIGVAARERTPVRISHMTNAASYSHAVRSSLRATEPGIALDTEIPFPGLAEPHSQLAAPIVSGGRLLGALFVESPLDMHFSFEDEDALVAIASHLGAALELLRQADEPAAEEPAPPAAPSASGAPLPVRHYLANNSVFVADNYLIKGVAGAILGKLLREYSQQGRTEFSNRELRLDPSIRLPDLADNLEARLVLLQRRLAENSPHLRIEKTGRGRFRLQVERPVTLTEIAG